MEAITPEEAAEFMHRIDIGRRPNLEFDMWHGNMIVECDGMMFRQFIEEIWDQEKTPSRFAMTCIQLALAGF